MAFSELFYIFNNQPTNLFDSLIVWYVCNLMTHYIFTLIIALYLHNLTTSHITSFVKTADMLSNIHK